MAPPATVLTSPRRFTLLRCLRSKIKAIKTTEKAAEVMNQDEELLGQIWSTETDPRAADAFKKGDLNSIYGDEETVRLCFRNDTPNPLTLCWVDNMGNAHHFYRLDPWRTRHGLGKKKIGHLETSSVGHAFLVAERSGERMSGRDGSATEVEVGQKKRKEWRKKKHSETKNTLILDPADVIVGYRPSKVSLASSEDEDENHDRDWHAHFVTISRRWRGGLLRGRSFGRDFDEVKDKPLWTYKVKVKEGSLGGRPYNTSKKVYRAMELSGWPVRCEDRLWTSSEKSKGESLLTREHMEVAIETKVKEMIELDLDAAAACLPVHALKVLRKNTPFWINRSQLYGPSSSPVQGNGICYHPGAGWLKSNGMSAKKAKGIELYRATKYLEDRNDWGPGGVLLHELSHAYHDKCTKGGYENKLVKECYDKAMAKGLYDSVRVHGVQGPKSRACKFSFLPCI